MERISLYYKEGTSDKEYHAEIVEKDGGFVVNFSFGRRGSTLQTGTKTQGPVAFEKAKAIFDKLVSEKTAKGYSPGEAGTPYQMTPSEKRSTGILPQLLNPVEEDEAVRLIADAAFWMQEKKDGKRILIRKDESGAVIGINRKGLEIGLPASVVEHAKAISGAFVVDGEAVGDKLFAFDCLSRNGADLKAKPYSERLKALAGFVRTGAIECVPTATEKGDKADLFRALRERNAEGVVFKRHDAPYAHGRPASGGSQLKFKFYATASCIVSKVNAKRSVALELADAGKPIAVGNVTIPPNKAVPKEGAVIEVRFLYAYKGGSLFQPTYLGERDDIEAGACTVAQLKFRQGETEDDEA